MERMTLIKSTEKCRIRVWGSAFAALRAVIPYKACYIDFPRLYLPRESLANVIHIRHSGPTKFEAVYLVLLKAREMSLCVVVVVFDDN